MTHSILVIDQRVADVWVGTPRSDLADKLHEELFAKVIEIDVLPPPGALWNGSAFYLPSSLPTRENVAAERTRRLQEGFTRNFGGSAGIRTLDMRGPADETNWLGLKATADHYIANGAADTLLTLRDAGNETFHSSAETVSQALFEMAQWKSEVLERSWELQDMNPIPADFVDDKYWP